MASYRRWDRPIARAPERNRHPQRFEHGLLRHRAAHAIPDGGCAVSVIPACWQPTQNCFLFGARGQQGGSSGDPPADEFQSAWRALPCGTLRQKSERPAHLLRSGRHERDRWGPRKKTRIAPGGRRTRPTQMLRKKQPVRRASGHRASITALSDISEQRAPKMAPTYRTMSEARSSLHRTVYRTRSEP